jgi:amino acid permease
MNNYIVLGITVMLFGCVSMVCYIIYCDDILPQNIEEMLENTPSPMRNESSGHIEL